MEFDFIHSHCDFMALWIAPAVAEQYRDSVRVPAGPGAELPCGFQTQVAIDYFTVRARQDRNLKTDLPNAPTHPIDGRVILSGVSGAEDDLVDRPDLDFHCLRNRHGTPRSDNMPRFSRDLS